MHTFIIGEPGATHEGKLETMFALIDIAADAGADCYKSQWVSDAQRLCDRRHAPDYYTDYRKIQYPLSWHGLLRAHCEKRGLQYGCSVYLPGDATVIAPFVDLIKISSFEADDSDMLAEARAVSHNVVVSLGMGAQPRHWLLNVKYLHCVSSYPAPLDAMNLQDVILCDGLSDHSRDVRMGGWAVCAGAAMIETHFRTDECDPQNKDHVVAFTPEEFTEYVRHVRDAERVFGGAFKRGNHPCEDAMRAFKVR